MSFERDETIVERLFYERKVVQLSRTHCVDKMGPDPEGYYEFHYDYELLEFSLGGEVLHAKAYANDPEAFLVSLEVAGERRSLDLISLDGTLARAAIDYFQSRGRSKVRWLNPQDAKTGHTLVRRKRRRAAT